MKRRISWQLIGLCLILVGSLFSFTGSLSAQPGAPRQQPGLADALDDAARVRVEVATKQQLRSIAVGLHNWNDIYPSDLSLIQTYPDYAEKGRLKLSWRVHLLPMLDTPDGYQLYQKFRLNEPWDSPHNKALISQMPEIYRHPDDKKGTDKTRFVGLEFPGSLFQSTTFQSFSKITDERSETILVMVAPPEKAVVWTQPDDLQIDPATPLQSLGLKPDQRLQYLTVEGSVLRLGPGATDAQLRALLTIAGGETDLFGEGGPKLNQVAQAPSANAPDMPAGNEPSAAPSDKEQDPLLILMNAAHEFEFNNDVPAGAHKPEHLQQGHAKLSWRVHLLPYLNEVELYKQFRMNEAWDSPHNKALISKIPDIYRHPSDKPGVTTTRYLGVDAPGSYAENGNFKKIRFITDGTSGTLALLEAPADKAVIWTKPDDLEIDPKAPLKALGTIPEQGIRIVTVLGDLHTLQPSLTDKEWMALVSIAGDDNHNLPELDAGSPLAPRKPSGKPAGYWTDAGRRAGIKNQLKQFGLGMLIYQDIHRRAGVGPKYTPPNQFQNGRPKLSWRVHLLPFIEETALYNRFRLEEPWDSPHNKALIPYMPDIFRYPGDTPNAETTRFVAVEANGALYQRGGFVQSATNGDPRFNEVHDNREDTLMMMVAPKDKAVLWTKPDELKVDINDPLKGLGTIPKDGLYYVTLDGAVRLLEPNITTEQFKALLTINGAETDIFEEDGPKIGRPVVERPDNAPGMLSSGAPQTAPASEEPLENLQQIFTAMQEFSDSHDDSQIGALDPDHKHNDHARLSWRVHILPHLGEEDLYEQFHLNEAWDSPHNKALISKMPAVYRHPKDRPNLTTTRYLAVEAPGTFAQDGILRSFADVQDGAESTLALIEAPPEKAVIWTKPDDLLVDPRYPLKALGRVPEAGLRFITVSGSLHSLKPSLTAQQWMALNTIAAGDGEKLPELEQSSPALRTKPTGKPPVSTTGKDSDEAIKTRLKAIGQGMKYFEDLFGKVGIGHNWGTPEYFENGRPKLSWRVALLPFLDEAALYNKFRMDEPWDSPHNKALIPLMPDVFRLPGDAPDVVTTRFRAIEAEGALYQRDGFVYSNKSRPSNRVLDEHSETLMIVAAPPDKSVIWTKPDELEVDLKEPLKGLGTIPKEGLHFLTLDTSVQKLEPTVSNKQLRALLTIAGNDSKDLPKLAPPTPPELEKPSGMPPSFNNESERQVAIRSQMKELALAMINNKDIYGQVGVGISDSSNPKHFENDRPKLSWRVHLLPMLNQNSLFQQFRLDEPWDSPHNKALIPLMPDVFRHPNDVPNAETTRFVAVEANGALYDRGGFAPPGNFRGDTNKVRDKHSETLMLIEAPADKAVIWTKPDELQVDIDDALKGLGAIPKEGLHFLTLDGAVRKLQSNVTSNHFKALLTIAGGENVDLSDSVSDTPRGAARGSAMAQSKPEPLVFPKATPEELERLRKLDNLTQVIQGFHRRYQTIPVTSTWPDRKTYPEYFDQGRPKLSWRVHLLPYLFEEELYKQFRLDEAWDSPHNKALISKMPSVYRHPSDKSGLETTRYIGVEAPGSVFQRGVFTGMEGVTDPPSEFVMIVEAPADQAVIWTKPDDMVVDFRNPLKALGAIPSEGFKYAALDGTINKLEPSLTDKQWLALLTYTGGEYDIFSPDGPKRARRPGTPDPRAMNKAPEDDEKKKRNIFLCFVLLKRQKSTVVETVRKLDGKKVGGHLFTIDKPAKTKDPNIVGIEVGGIEGAIGLMPGPFPLASGEKPEETVVLFPPGTPLPPIERHQTHLLLTLFPDKKSNPIEFMLLFSELVANISRHPDVVAIYWPTSGMLFAPDFFRKVVQEREKPDEPLPILWVKVLTSKNGDRSTAKTYGMKSLGLMEMEAIDIRMSEGDLHILLLDFCNYVLVNGPVLEDGNTIGQTATRKFKIRHVESDDPDRGTVIQFRD